MAEKMKQGKDEKDENFQCYYSPGGKPCNEDGVRELPQRIKKPSELKIEEELLGNIKWSMREQCDLLEAMKKYGNYDYDNIAAAVRTRNKLEVKRFVEVNIDRLRKRVFTRFEGGEVAKSAVKGRGYDLSLENLEDLPNLELWRMIANLQMKNEHKSPDYSYIMSDLFKIFGDNEESSEDPDLPDFKELYYFLSETFRGNWGPELRPINASILAGALDDAMELAEDSASEKKFFEEFSGTKPKTVICEEEVDAPSTSSHSAGEEVLRLPVSEYEEYLQHSKISSNLNPLGIDKKMLEAASKHLATFLKNKKDFHLQSQ